MSVLLPADGHLLWAGLAISTYDASQKLNDFFVVTSLSSDKKGAEYISTMEARKVQDTPHALLTIHFLFQHCCETMCCDVACSLPISM